MPTVNLETLSCLKSPNTENKKRSGVALGLDNSSAAPHHAGLSFFLSLHHLMGEKTFKALFWQECSQLNLPFFALS